MSVLLPSVRVSNVVEFWLERSVYQTPVDGRKTVTSRFPSPSKSAKATSRIVPGSAYVRPLVSVPDWPSEFVTTTFTEPAACAGADAVMVVASTRTTFAAARPPIVTLGAVEKFAPVIVTGMFPGVEIVDGVIAVTLGAAATTIGRISTAAKFHR